MAKRRSCRRTIDENIVHGKAVKIRKMTDEQLVHYIENQMEKARSEGFNQGNEQVTQYKSVRIEEILREIGNVRGIGSSKLNSIKTIIEKYLGVCSSV